MRNLLYIELIGQILRKSVDIVLKMEEDIVSLSLFELKNGKGENNGKEN